MVSALERLREMKRTQESANSCNRPTNPTKPCADETPNLDALRVDFARLHERIITLRCQEPPTGTRQAALAFLHRKAEALAARCDVTDADGRPIGYHDPEDPFADDALRVLRSELAEAGAGPYPLGPLPVDPFAAGRLYNGKQK